MFASTAYHRRGRAPFGRCGTLCTSRSLFLFFVVKVFRFSSPVTYRGDVQVLVVEALKVTLTRHMTHGVSGFGRSDSDKGHPFPWPFLFIQQLANSRRNGSET
jgi:hypothetical protein